MNEALATRLYELEDHIQKPKFAASLSPTRDYGTASYNQYPYGYLVNIKQINLISKLKPSANQKSSNYIDLF
jgi:hypothetical protein